jgi:hypothetical protein
LENIKETDLLENIEKFWSYYFLVPFHEVYLWVGTGFHWLWIGWRCIFLWTFWWNLKLCKTRGIWLAERPLASHEKRRCTERISYGSWCVLWTGPRKESQRCDARAEGNDVFHMQRENMTTGTAVAYPTGSERLSFWARFWPVSFGSKFAVNHSSVTIRLVICFNWTPPLFTCTPKSKSHYKALVFATSWTHLDVPFAL